MSFRRHAANAISGLALLFVVGINLASLDSRLYWPRPVLQAGHALGLMQTWGMYSRIPHETRRFEASGSLANGEVVDLVRGGGARWQRVRATHESYDFRNYYRALNQNWFAPMRAAYADWLCRSWNDDPTPARLLSVELFVFTRALTPGEPPGPEQRQQLIRHDCAAADQPSRIAP